MIKIRKSNISFETRTENDMVVISISGSLDKLATRDLKTELNQVIDAHNHRLILDLRKVSFADSSCVGVIWFAALEVRKRKGDIKLFGLADGVRKTFDVLTHSDVFEIFETKQEAMNSFS